MKKVNLKLFIMVAAVMITSSYNKVSDEKVNPNETIRNGGSHNICAKIY